MKEVPSVCTKGFEFRLALIPEGGIARAGSSKAAKVVNESQRLTFMVAPKHTGDVWTFRGYWEGPRIESWHESYRESE